MSKFIAIKNFKNGKGEDGKGVFVKVGAVLELSKEEAKPLVKAGVVSSHADVIAQKKEELEVKKAALQAEIDLLEYDISQLGKAPKAEAEEAEEGEESDEEDPAPKKKKSKKES